MPFSERINITNRSLVAIHQPNFFPWLGYFDKIVRSDYFVILDDVAYPKSGNSMGSWTNRVKLLINGLPQWISCPVVREQGVQVIQDVKIDYQNNWQENRMKTIELNYKKAPYFIETAEFVFRLLQRNEKKIADYNSANIIAICEKLQLPHNIVRQSEMRTNCHSTDLLIEIVQKVGGTSYMCGGGASGYQEDERFATAGIELVYQGFKHPQYKQFRYKEFQPGMSILDAMFNCGFEKTRHLLGQN